MHSAARPPFRTMLVALALVAGAVAAPPAQAQVQQGSSGTLAFSTKNAAAADELRAAITDYNTWSWKSAADHVTKALELDPSFGLARVWKALIIGGPTGAAELRRAAADAVNGNATEAVLALAARENPQNARVLFDAAVALAPNDPAVALSRAANLSDTARVLALREMAAKYPDDVGVHMWLAFYLTPWSFAIDPVAKEHGDEAMRAAGEAVRVMPRAAGPHTAMGHVLHALGRDAEAQQHLVAASNMTPKAWYTYQLLADIYSRDGKFAEARDALDSAIAWSPNLGQSANDRRARASNMVGSGDVTGAMAGLAQLVKELDAIDARGQLGTTHLWMAILSAAARDSAGAVQHIAAAKQYNPAAGLLADNEVITYSAIGNGAEARRALGDYVRAANALQNLTPSQEQSRTENIHRQTGLVLLAEKKPQEALAELKQGGRNPWAAYGIIEAYRMMKNGKQADAERTAFFARREFTYNSTALAAIRYRALKTR